MNKRIQEWQESSGSHRVIFNFSFQMRGKVMKFKAAGKLVEVPSWNKLKSGPSIQAMNSWNVQHPSPP